MPGGPAGSEGALPGWSFSRQIATHGKRPDTFKAHQARLAWVRVDRMPTVHGWTHDGRQSKGKKAFMIQFWRMQQSQAFVNSFFFATTLALLLMPYLGAHITALTGSPILTFWALFWLVMGLILVFGYAFDNVWKLWKEQVTVGTERNPYAVEKLSAKEVVVWRHLNLPLLRAVGYHHSAQILEAWVSASVSEDPRLRKDVESLEAWLMGSTERPSEPPTQPPTEPPPLPGPPEAVLGPPEEFAPPGLEIGHAGPNTPARK